MAQILNFANVDLYYERVYALKNVSLTVNEGETVALIGANGAGKSSILRAITGLRKIKSGEIHYDGRRIDGASPAELVRQGIAMVPEGRHVFPYMTVKDNLLMGAFTRSDKAGIARSIVAINRDERVSVLLVEQNSRMALRISHRAYALATGSIALSGASADLLKDDRVKSLYLGGDL